MTNKATEAAKLAFAKRFNWALSEGGFPKKGKGLQQEIKHRWSVSHEAARKWVDGEAIPRHTMVENLARDLNVSFAWLLTGDGQARSGVAENPEGYAVFRLPPSSIVPVISWADAARWPGSAAENPSELEQTHENVGNKGFAAKVEIDAMSSGAQKISVPAGAMVFVNTTDESLAESGSLVVIKSKTSDEEATVRQLFREGSSSIFKAFNDAYPTFTDETHEVVGVIVGLSVSVA